MFDELLRLLRELGASDELIANLERFAATQADGYDGDPVSDDDLDAILSGLVALAENDETSAALIEAAADAADTVRAEQTRREDEATEEEAAREAAAARLRGETAQDDGDDDGESGDDDGETADDAAADDSDAEGEGDDAGETDDAGAEREPVTASNNATRRAAARRRPRAAQPAANDEGRADIVFAAGLSDVRPGHVTHDLRDVDRAMEQLYGSFRRSSGRADGAEEYLRVATVQARFPQERRLVDDAGESLAPSAITRRIQSVVDGAIEAAMRPEGRSLVAAGGLCAPPTPIYNIVTYGDARRPIRDTALVSFLASRGGVTDLTPPRLGDLSGAVSAWTVANDVDAAPDGVPSKPCLRVVCGAARTTQIEAIPFCLTVGNFLARTMNEIPTAWSSLGQVAHARFAESRLIAAMQALATTVTTTTSDWSATRDVLNELSQAAWGMRSRHRLPDDFPFRAILPSILRGIMQTDISRQLPGGSTRENLALALTQLDEFFSVRNINVTWSPDMNIVGTQGAGTVLAHWPPTVNYLIYPEGTFIHLDGGELDLGVVRDSTLNKVNDFQIFSETFEGVHMVGTEAIDGAIDVCPTGAVSGSIDPAPFCASYSA